VLGLRLQPLCDRLQLCFISRVDLLDRTFVFLFVECADIKNALLGFLEFNEVIPLDKVVVVFIARVALPKEIIQEGLVPCVKMVR